MRKIITPKQKGTAWRMYRQGRSISEIAREIGVSYSSGWALTEGRKQGFKNRGEYWEHLAQQRINPDTGQCFKNYGEYREHLAIKQGFKNYGEYREHLAQQRQLNSKNKELSDLIMLRLKKLGKNQTWFAEQLSVTRQAASLYVHGKITPRKDTLEKVFTVLEVTNRLQILDDCV